MREPFHTSTAPPAQDPKARAVFNWSGGKDSALALWKILAEGRYEIVALLTTVNREEQRSTMHGIPVSLLHRQAERIGIPLHIVDLTPQGGMIDYNKAMHDATLHFAKQGVTHFIFGDIFLHDVKAYREEKLTPLGITVVEPLWGMTPGDVMEMFLQSGLQTVIVTTNAELLDERYIGRTIDRELIDGLPPGIDICGENGEYHTFCHDGPLFDRPIPFCLGEPRQATYPVRLDDGTVRDYSYWFAGLADPS